MIEGRAAGYKRQRIEIALHRQSGLHLLTHQVEVGGPVEAHGIEPQIRCIADNPAAKV